MNYADFKAQICRRVGERLPGAYVGLRQVLKNNSLRQDALTIGYGQTTVAPMIYLNDYYLLYQKGTDLETITEHIIRVYQECQPDVVPDISFLEDWDRVSPYIVRRLVNRDMNLERIEHAPHLDFLDLSLIYYMVVKEGDDAYGGFMITDDTLEMWGISAEELDRTAADNTPRIWAPLFISLPALLKELVPSKAEEISQVQEEEGDYLYVLTSRTKYFGSVWMSDQAVLGKIARKLDSDFYVLPSSVHECLILPDSPTMIPGDLRDMVVEVNQTQVLPEEVLSNNVYFFSRQEAKLMIA